MNMNFVTLCLVVGLWVGLLFLSGCAVELDSDDLEDALVAENTATSDDEALDEYLQALLLSCVQLSEQPCTVMAVPHSAIPYVEGITNQQIVR